MRNNELIQLLNLEKSLTYFTTSLKSNQLLFEKLMKTRLIQLDARTVTGSKTSRSTTGRLLKCRTSTATSFPE